MGNKDFWKFNQKLHETTPLFIGSEEYVIMVEKFMAKEEVNSEIYFSDKP